MSPVFVLEIKDAKKDKIFKFLKGSSSVVRVPGYDFWRVFRDLYETSNKYNFGIVFKVLKRYNNLNVKKYLKLNVP